MKPRALLLVALATGAGVSMDGAGALTVGRPQGIPLVGRPMDLAVPIALEAASEALPECVEADVFYGDSRVARDRVTTDLQPSATGGTVRVRAQAAVNEPVVTIYLQLGCGNRLSRRLVLFAEQPDPEADRLADIRAAARTVLPSVAPMPAASASAWAPVPAPAAERAASAPRRSSARTDARQAAGSAARASRAPAAGAVASQAPVRASAASRPARQAGRNARARLKLEPLDLTAPAPDPQLRITDGMATPAPASDEQRALAIALWKALNAKPEDLLRDAQRLQAMESDLRSLRQSIQRNEAALAEMRTQVQRAQDQRYVNPVVYVLGVLALLALAAAAWFWRKSARAPAAQWWSGTDSDPDLMDVQPRQVPADDWRHAAEPARAPEPAPLPKPKVEMAPPSSRDSESDAPASMPPSSRPPSFFHSMDGFQGSVLGPRAMKAEELHDVQQEADFFVSLGEYDRAVEVLRSHIAANPQTSAVAWLDLIEIFHLLGRRSEYDEVRREFQGLFNAEVPAFENYSEAGPSLEEYTSAIERICVLWPHPRVLEVIEESIFHGPRNDGSQAFSLAAYRDLLMLHHIGSEALLEEAGREPVRMPALDDDGEPADPAEAEAGFASTNISPLSAISVTTMPIQRRPQEDEDPLPEIGLDIDLGDLELGEQAAGEEAIGAAAKEDGHMLDFDLPEIDMSAFATKKTRE